MTHYAQKWVSIREADYHIEAVRIWQKVNTDLKRFSECCANVENKEALAADCKCSLRTIQFYSAAWDLYQELLREYGNETVSLMWERGEISLWRKAPQLRSTLELSLGKTKEYLEIAIEHGMNRDSFAAHVDNKENKIPAWQRRLRWVVDKLTPSKTDWKSEMPYEKQERYNRAVETFTNELKAIAEDE